MSRLRFDSEEGELLRVGEFGMGHAGIESLRRLYLCQGGSGALQSL